MDGCGKNKGFIYELKLIPAHRQFIQLKKLTGYLPLKIIFNFILCSIWFFHGKFYETSILPFLSMFQIIYFFLKCLIFLQYIGKSSKQNTYTHNSYSVVQILFLILFTYQSSYGATVVLNLFCHGKNEL